MSSNFQIDFTSLGLKKEYLYEILVTTFSLDENLMIPNTASMGVRLVDKDIFKIWPYPNTTTYKNLEKSKILVLNFVDDVYLYALASLKGFNLSKSERALSEEYYSYYTLNINREHKNPTQIPYLKQAWAIIACSVTSINQFLKKDDFGEFELMEIDLTVISLQKFRESFKLFNRAENITLETIVLATKLRVAIDKKEKALIRKIKGSIEENINNVKRFAINESSLKAIEYIEGYLKGLID